MKFPETFDFITQKENVSQNFDMKLSCKFWVTVSSILRRDQDYRISLNNVPPPFNSVPFFENAYYIAGPSQAEGAGGALAPQFLAK